MRNFLLLSRSLQQNIPNLKAHTLLFLPHFVIPKAQNSNSLFSEGSIPLFVPRTLVGKAVAASIPFNCQSSSDTKEVEEVNATRILASELELLKTAVAKETPQSFLGVGGFVAEVTGEIAGLGCACTARPPHRSPLPLRGGEGSGSLRIAVIGHSQSWLVKAV